MSSENGSEPLDVVIIGAGIGGLIAASKLRSSGIERIAVLERADDIGGVWHANRYPNVACDTAIELYGISFFPGQKWSRNFAPGSEIQDYIKEFANRFDVRPLVRTNVDVTRAIWDDRYSEWQVEAADARNWRCRYLVWAGGTLSQPLLPSVPGLDTFAGRSFHTANWPADVDLTGKSVAVVGAGATAIQVVPYVAQLAKQAYVFVRTPSYVMPRPDIVFSPADQENPTYASEQAARRNAWSQQFDKIAEARFPMVDAVVAEQERNWRSAFEAQVSDPELRQIMTPRYRFGCKRPLFSNEYYPALSRPNVSVIGAGIDSVDERNVIDSDGNKYPVDVIIWATGFDAEGMLGNLMVVGSEGESLNAAWSDVPAAYFGVMVKGFPNLFLVNGPNVGGPSATEFAEGQSDLIAHAIGKAALEGAETITVPADVHEAFNADVQRRFDGSVLVLGNCSSWYRVGGDGAVFTHWPGTIASFRDRIKNEAPLGLAYNKRSSGQT